MLVDRRNIEILAGQRDARANGTALVAVEQHLDPRHDDVVAAHAVREHAMLVLLFLRAVDRHRDADIVLHHPVDHFLAQQGRVGRQARVHLLAECATLVFRIRQRRLQHLEVEQRLAAKERQIHARRITRLAEHEIDALLGRLLVHETRLGARFDDLVFAVLVAVAARQVALARDVEHERLKRNAALGLLGDRLRWRRGDRVNRPHAEQLVDRRTDVLDAPPRRERVGEVIRRSIAVRQPVEHCLRQIVEAYDCGRRHEVEILGISTIERVVLSATQ